MGLARHTAGLSWAYNTRPFFQAYYPHFNIGAATSLIPGAEYLLRPHPRLSNPPLGYWILACSILGGSFGVFAGGYFSDRVVSR